MILITARLWESRECGVIVPSLREEEKALWIPVRGLFGQGEKRNLCSYNTAQLAQSQTSIVHHVAVSI